MKIEIEIAELNLVMLALLEHINANRDSDWWARPHCGRINRERLKATLDKMDSEFLTALENEGRTVRSE